MTNCAATTDLTPPVARGVIASYLENSAGETGEAKPDVVYRALIRAELHTTRTPCTVATYALLRATLADMTGVERYRDVPEPAQG